MPSSAPTGLPNTSNAPGIRIVESNEDVLLYDTGHIPGAVHIDWRRDLNDQLVRDYIGPEAFADTLRRNGITPGHHGDLLRRQIQLVGLLRAVGLPPLRPYQVKILDGGRAKWVAEGRPLTREVPSPPRHPIPCRPAGSMTKSAPSTPKPSRT